ncbi:hypothetical protein CU097_008089 [Rhizopus azygosporus]|uniref:CCHC-type domain-containing protein n=1 Tax=Rhizopus azygosporus TaxID=86630 RepID=A0A367J2C5_RHIAZ|nr:hypothetical protein CU097_008089 [Rhizopus azygosporus]
MSSYCKYCHESGHAAPGCPKFSSGKRACFLCLKRGHVRADCPERTPTANDSDNITTETPSGEHDGSTSIPKSKETILVQDQHPEIPEEAAPPSIQEIDQNSPSSISRPSSLASATAEVHSDDEMEEISHSSEHSEEQH